MRRSLVDLDLDLGLVEALVGEALAEALARRFARALAGERVEQPVHRRFLRGGADLVAAALALEADRFLDEVAGDLLDVAADVADLGELGRLDLDERRVGEAGEAAADLGLAAAGGADHQDVLGRHFVAQLGAELLPAPAVAKRDGDRLLGIVLADDMLVQGGDDRLGRQLVLQHFGLLPAALGDRGLIVHVTRECRVRPEALQAGQRRVALKARWRAMILAIVPGSGVASHSPTSNVPPRMIPSGRGNM